MSLRTEAHDLVHAMLLAALAVDGATASTIIPANDRGPRPLTDYLTVRVLSLDRLSETETSRSATGINEVTHTEQQIRDARIALQAFGETAVGWLESLTLRLGWPSVLAVAAARETSPVRDLTEYLDTGFEPRAEMEIGVYLAITDDQGDTLVAAAAVELDAFGDTFTLPVE